MEKRTEERLYNYLEEYLTDSYAEVTGEAPIVFDWSNVRKVEPYEEVPWVNPAMAEASERRGMPVIKVHVCCIEHGHFNQVMQNPPMEKDGYCQHCITREIDRVISLRSRRDRERLGRRRA